MKYLNHDLEISCLFQLLRKYTFSEAVIICTAAFRDQLRQQFRLYIFD